MAQALRDQHALHEGLAPGTIEALSDHLPHLRAVMDANAATEAKQPVSDAPDRRSVRPRDPGGGCGNARGGLRLHPAEHTGEPLGKARIRRIVRPEPGTRPEAPDGGRGAAEAPPACRSLCLRVIEAGPRGCGRYRAGWRRTAARAFQDQSPLPGSWRRNRLRTMRQRGSPTSFSPQRARGGGGGGKERRPVAIARR